MIKYAAYGSNMSTVQMKIRCPGSKSAGLGFLPGYKLVFDSFSEVWNGPIADIEPTGSHADLVPVVVYDLTKSDMQNLDSFEGYPNKYLRKQQFIMMKDGGHELCWVYFLQPKHKGSYGAPNDSYLRQIKAAYLRFRFDLKRLASYVEESVKRSTPRNTDGQVF